MKIEIEIPEEFIGDLKSDRFEDFFERALADMNGDGCGGNYEREIAKMFICAFKNGIIDNQPQVQQWIPCSERLPTKEEHCKNDGRFIVSNGIKSYECTFDFYEEIFKQFGYNRKGIWMEYIDDKIIAWRPLPTPYQESEVL